MSNQLKAKLGLFSAVMVVVSAMIGSGVFKKVSLMSNDLHSSAWVLGAWL
jgi:APA family basic amino acid/polyamine antiporter